MTRSSISDLRLTAQGWSTGALTAVVVHEWMEDVDGMIRMALLLLMKKHVIKKNDTNGGASAFDNGKF